MKRSRSVCVTTDKNNSTRVIKTEQYKRWVSDHLLKAADLAQRLRVVALFEDANMLLEKVKMELSVQGQIFCEAITRNVRNYGSKNY